MGLEVKAVIVHPKATLSNEIVRTEKEMGQEEFIHAISAVRQRVKIYNRYSFPHLQMGWDM